MTKRYQKGKRRESLSMYSSSHKYQPLLYRRQTALSAAGTQLALTSLLRYYTGKHFPHLIKILCMLCSLKRGPWSGHNTHSKVRNKSGKNSVLDWSGEVEFCSCFPLTSLCLLHWCISVKDCRPFSKHNTSPGGIWSKQFLSAIQKVFYNAYAITIRYLG